MRGALIVLGILVVLLLWLGGSVAGNYNKLVRSKAEVDNRWAQVNNQLQRRGDLIGQLVESVKGAATQEQVVFGEIASARAAMAGAHTPEKGIPAAQQMDSAIGRLLVVVENYPQLKSDATFNRLMDELAGTENRLAVERKRYNDAVQVYNTTIRRFPDTLIASMLGFKEQPFFQVPEAARQAPQVKF